MNTIVYVFMYMKTKSKKKFVYNTCKLYIFESIYLLCKRTYFYVIFYFY